jgi:hypothetical protein
MTIAQQLKVTKFPFIIKDDKGNTIYQEQRSGRWDKHEWDNNGREIYYEDSTGFWCKIEWDDNGNEIYYENSNGHINDRRPKPWRHDLIAQMEEIVSRLEEDGLYALQGIKDTIAELKK